MGGRDQGSGEDPGDRRRPPRARGRRQRHRRRPVRLRRHGTQDARRPGAAQQADRGPPQGHPALHLLLRLCQPDLREPAGQMRGQPADRPRGRDPPRPAEKPGHVLVVGGGPAGMEAARAAALRGHKVTLVERSSRLGGTLFFAALAYAENGAPARLPDHADEEARHRRAAQHRGHPQAASASSAPPR